MKSHTSAIFNSNFSCDFSFSIQSLKSLNVKTFSSFSWLVFAVACAGLFFSFSALSSLFFSLASFSSPSIPEKAACISFNILSSSSFSALSKAFFISFRNSGSLTFSFISFTIFSTCSGLSSSEDFIAFTNSAFILLASFISCFFSSCLFAWFSKYSFSSKLLDLVISAFLISFFSIPFLSKVLNFFISILDGALDTTDSKLYFASEKASLLAFVIFLASF